MPHLIASYILVVYQRVSRIIACGRPWLLPEMAAFSAANRDAAGKPRCFNFWRRAPAV